MKEERQQRKINKIKLIQSLKEDNADLQIHSIEEKNGFATVIIILQNNYYPLLKIDTIKKNVKENLFLKKYDGIVINRLKILDAIKTK